MPSADLHPGRIEQAARDVDRVFRDSPQFVSEQLSAALGLTLLVKVETATPLGILKGRGSDFLLRSLPEGSTVVWASRRNFGVALAYAARARGISVHVYVSSDINPAKRARMQSLDAQVRMTGDSVRAARAHAAAHPR